jgi:cytochrome c
MVSPMRNHQGQKQETVRKNHRYPTTWGETEYDAQEYLNMLFSAVETLFGVFGYNKNRIQAEVLHQEKQATLC